MDNLLAIDEITAKQLSELIRTTDIAALATSPLDIPDPEVSIENRVAIIPIKGFLTKENDSGFIRFLIGGGTSYKGIISRVQAADANAEVDSIKYIIDSPGGEVNGLFDAARVIRESKKPSIAFISGKAASGAYGLAAQADKIVASNVADMVGSIGIVQSFFVSENVIDITSSNAPFKAPDPKTDAGIKAIKEQLDMVESHFINTIAEGRKIKASIVRSEYGRGMILTADIAMRRGMVDSIENDIPVQGGGDASASTEIFAGPTTFQNLEIIDRRWDKTAAISRVRRATNSTEKPSKDYRKAFYWFDTGDKENFGAYKLPFVDVVDGKLVAVRSAINAANGAMAGARGGVDIPEKDMAAVQRHIDKYKAKIEKQDEEKSTSKTLNTGGKGMTLRALLDENPEAKVEHDAELKGARAQGATDERTRVTAHMANIEHSKDVVVKAIAEGTPFDQASMSVYMNAGLALQHGKKIVKENPGAVTTVDDEEVDSGIKGGSEVALSKSLDGALEAAGSSSLRL